jgi:hypothetical protein
MVMNMDKKSLIAPCGLDCFNCGIFEANLTDELRNKFAIYHNIQPEEVACRGCKSEKGKYFGESICATWDCAEHKGVEFCYECGEFPCGLLSPTAQGASYPHNMKVYNLCRMKLLGLDAWFEEASHIRKRYYDGKFVIGKGPVLDE